MAKYKPGDKVKVRSDLGRNIIYHMENDSIGVEVNDDMIARKNSIVTIKEMDSCDRYFIEEDCWHWTDEMFSEKITKVENKFEIGDKVHFRKDLREDMTIYAEDGDSMRVYSPMADFAGEIAIITEKNIRGNGYKVDTNNFIWYASAFEDEDKVFTGTVANFNGVEIKIKPPFEIGDRVLVRTDLEERKSYKNVSNSKSDTATEYMLNFCGKVCTISDSYGKYRLKEDEKQMNWTETMFILDKDEAESILNSAKSITATTTSITDKAKESAPLSTKEDLVARQYFIPTRLEHFAERYPTVTWTKAKQFYKQAVTTVLIQHGESNLFSGDLTFGRGLQYAAQEFEKLLREEERFIHGKELQTFKLVFDKTTDFDKIADFVSKSDLTKIKAEKKDCFSCTEKDCTSCENWMQKMAIT